MSNIKRKAVSLSLTLCLIAGLLASAPLAAGAEEPVPTSIHLEYDYQYSVLFPPATVFRNSTVNVFLSVQYSDGFTRWLTGDEVTIDVYYDTQQPFDGDVTVNYSGIQGIFCVNFDQNANFAPNLRATLNGHTGVTDTLGFHTLNYAYYITTSGQTDMSKVKAFEAEKGKDTQLELRVYSGYEKYELVENVAWETVRVTQEATNTPTEFSLITKDGKLRVGQDESATELRIMFPFTGGQPTDGGQPTVRYF